MIARNLLGRLNARTPDDLQRIAALWLVPLPGADRGRHVGTLYRTMTDIRYARSFWERLDPNAQTVVRDLAASESGALTIDELAALTRLSTSIARDAAILLFHSGLLAREGDNQELPIGALPKLFLPREVGQVFRRVQEEIDAGDLSDGALRTLLESLDDPELEEAAAIWGIRVIPGQRRRVDLVTQTVRQIGLADRVEQVLARLSRPAAALWKAVKSESPSPVLLHTAVQQANLTPPGLGAPGHITDTARVESALAELEGALLVFHTYLRDGSRWLFVPLAISQPETAANLPLRPLQPLPEDRFPEVDAIEPYAVACDLLTVVREISDHGAPLWVPGEPISRSWQRRLNRRLWAAGDEVPPRGYLGFLLYLGVAVNAIGASDQPLPTGADKSAIRPEAAPTIREWTRLTFDAQIDRLREAWLESDAWIEGREREEIEIWGADWRGFRRRLLDAIAGLDPGEWLMVDDLAGRLAEQHPAIIGATFTAASARAARDDLDERATAIAHVIEVELETAISWFGVVQLGHVPGSGDAVRPAPANDVADETAAVGPSLVIDEHGLIVVPQPAALQIWSLSAFADIEQLRPQVAFQLRHGSVGRALTSGFDLEQIVAYLETQSSSALPESLVAQLRGWAVGHRRVRIRRAVILNPDDEESTTALRALIAAAGYQVVDQLTPDGDLIVLLAAPEPGANPEDALLATLRAAGYAGQWDTPPRRS
ncbi:MAG: helicase-associated domain-containing protein [Chloroflexia bacterium]|nr:helicase-associated domain-containing protein [Chloroflexia bacterium]